MGPSIPKGFCAPSSFHCLCCINALLKCHSKSLAFVVSRCSDSERLGLQQPNKAGDVQTWRTFQHNPTIFSVADAPMKNWSFINSWADTVKGIKCCCTSKGFVRSQFVHAGAGVCLGWIDHHRGSTNRLRTLRSSCRVACDNIQSRTQETVL